VRVYCIFLAEAIILGFMMDDAAKDRQELIQLLSGISDKLDMIAALLSALPHNIAYKQGLQRFPINPDNVALKEYN
jgi:hypothetical protein